MSRVEEDAPYGRRTKDVANEDLGRPEPGESVEGTASEEIYCNPSGMMVRNFFADQWKPTHFRKLQTTPVDDRMPIQLPYSTDVRK